MRECLQVIFCCWFMSSLGSIIAAEPCPSQSDGLKCDYINGIAHDNSAPYCLCAGDVDTVEVGQRTSITISSWPLLNDTEKLQIIMQPIVTVNGSFMEVLGPYANNPENETRTVVELTAVRAGKSVLSFSYVGNDTNETVFKNLHDVARPANVIHFVALNIVSEVVGWLYFIMWSVSFYPQVILNFRRCSVVGLNFDFLILNITGYLCYSAFNLSLFLSPVIQDQYFAIHRGGVNPVQINDVVFAVHGLALSSFTGFQALILKRGKQKVSKIAIVLLILMYLLIAVCMIVALAGPLSWLNYLYILSYIKLAVTVFKYTPQAWQNFKRKSTVGWSIGQIILDFAGGVLSISQMFIISYNYDDWPSVFGDPTKFGLGLISILFDLLFMFQHYVLYRKARKEQPKDEEEREDDQNEIETNRNPKKLQSVLTLPSFVCCECFSVKQLRRSNDERTPLLSD